MAAVGKKAADSAAELLGAVISMLTGWSAPGLMLLAALVSGRCFHPGWPMFVFSRTVVAIVAAMLLGGSLLWLFPTRESMLFAQIARLTTRWRSPGVDCRV